MRKKVDSRIRTLVENCVRLNQRGLVVLVGDKGRDQVVNLHYMLSKAAVKARPSVLWCYKKDLYLSRCVRCVMCVLWCVCCVCVCCVCVCQKRCNRVARRPPRTRPCSTLPTPRYSHRKKRMQQIKKMAQRGLLDPEKEDPFALFVASTNIRWALASRCLLLFVLGLVCLEGWQAGVCLFAGSWQL
jgi:N-acetyltransferase 10